MDIDSDAVPFGDAENDVEMAVDVVVDAGRVESADEIGAFAATAASSRSAMPALAQDARLRKGDDLDVDEMRRGFASAESTASSPEAASAIDVDMGAKRRVP